MEQKKIFWHKYWISHRDKLNSRGRGQNCWGQFGELPLTAKCRERHFDTFLLFDIHIWTLSYFLTRFWHLTLFCGNGDPSIQNIWLNFLIYHHHRNCLLSPKVLFSVLFQEKNIFMEIHICVFNPTAENLSGDKSSRFLMELFRQIKWGRWKIMAAVVNSNFPYNFKIFTFYQSNLGHRIFLYFHHRQKDTG